MIFIKHLVFTRRAEFADKQATVISNLTHFRFLLLLLINRQLYYLRYHRGLLMDDRRRTFHNYRLRHGLDRFAQHQLDQIVHCQLTDGLKLKSRRKLAFSRFFRVYSLHLTFKIY